MASYAFHARAHYEAIDRALVGAATAAGEDPGGAAHFGNLSGQQGVPLIIRLFDEAGRLLGGSDPEHDTAPAADPRSVLEHPSGPAYGFFPALAPSIVSVPRSPGAFGILHDGQQRWRVFVHSVDRGAGEEPAGRRAAAPGIGAAGTPDGGDIAGATPPQDTRAAAAPRAPTPPAYVLTLAPLGALDESMAEFRVILTGVGLLGVAVAAVGSWAVAGSALRPIARLTEAARAIAASRDLSRRVHATGRDELSMLATTFNEMLDSIETAYRLQQRFVADASHELRAPLTAILGNLDLLRRRPDLPPEERQEALEEARREAERLSRLVADLLALARADAGMPLARRPLDLDAVVLDAFQEARRLARGQQLALDPFEPVQVEGDGDRLKQLLLILLDNAIKYTPEGGRITVGLRAAAGAAEIIVRDTGVGIPAKDLPHVFERFYRADPARSRDPGGTGLGLSIARWIVEQHAGEITLASEPGKGTTVTVRLPRAS